MCHFFFICESSSSVCIDLTDCYPYHLTDLVAHRYKDGELLTAEDEKAVEKLLVHHPHSEDKIGCGLNSIMVNCILCVLVKLFYIYLIKSVLFLFCFFTSVWM